MKLDSLILEKVFLFMERLLLDFLYPLSIDYQGSLIPNSCKFKEQVNKRWLNNNCFGCIMNIGKKWCS